MDNKFEKLIEKLQDKYDRSEVITKKDFEGYDIDDVVYVLKEIGLIEWWCEHYGEPGYKDPEKEILFANWNFVDNELVDEIEKSGYSVEWSDEWIQSEEGLAFRTQADSYGWLPSYYVCDGTVYSIEGNEEDYIEKVLLNNYDHAAPDWLDLTKYGFEKVTDSNVGWYEECKNISPKELVDKYVSEDEDFVFKIEENGPWCVKYTLWSRPKVMFKGLNVELDGVYTDCDSEVTERLVVNGEIIDRRINKKHSVYAIFDVIKKNEQILNVECVEENFGSDYVDLLEDAENFLLMNI